MGSNHCRRKPADLQSAKRFSKSTQNSGFSVILIICIIGVPRLKAVVQFLFEDVPNHPA